MARDGSFEVRGVPPGWWHAVGRLLGGGKRLLARMPHGGRRFRLEGVVLHLDRGSTLTGTVPALPKQVNVSLRGADPMPGAAGPQWDKTRTSFTIADAIPGSYMLSVNVPAAVLREERDAGRPRYVGRGGFPHAVGRSGSDGDRGRCGFRAGPDSGLRWQSRAGLGHALAGGKGPPYRCRLRRKAVSRSAGLAPGDYAVYGWDDIQQVEYADPEWMRRNGGQGSQSR